MSESTSSDNPEAGQAAEVKNGESKEECTKEPGWDYFVFVSFLSDEATFLWLGSFVGNNGYEINEVLKQD